MTLPFLLGISMAHAPLWVIAFTGGALAFFSTNVQEWLQR
jgi:hypothetical protein